MQVILKIYMHALKQKRETMAASQKMERKKVRWHAKCMRSEKCCNKKIPQTCTRKNTHWRTIYSQWCQANAKVHTDLQLSGTTTFSNDSLSLSVSHKPTHTREVSCVSASLSGAATACLWVRPLPKPPRCGRKRESKKKWAGDQACAQCSSPYELNGLADGHVAWIKRKSERQRPLRRPLRPPTSFKISAFARGSVRGRKGGKGISHLVFFLAAASALFYFITAFV